MSTAHGNSANIWIHAQKESFDAYPRLPSESFFQLQSGHQLNDQQTLFCPRAPPSPNSPLHQLTQQSQAPAGEGSQHWAANGENRVCFWSGLAGVWTGSPLIYHAYKSAGRNTRFAARQRVCKLEREGLPSVDQLPGDRQSCSSTGERRSIAHFSGE